MRKGIPRLYGGIPERGIGFTHRKRKTFHLFHPRLKRAVSWRRRGNLEKGRGKKNIGVQKRRHIKSLTSGSFILTTFILV